jgi:O-antigen ligase/tetratricopeptide (TPR) repeat protein
MGRLHFASRRLPHWDSLGLPVPGTSPTLAVLLVHVVLSALLLSVFSVEVFEYPKVLLLRTSAVALGLAALFEFVRSERRGGERRAQGSAWRDPLVWCGIAFLASGLASALHGVSPRRSLLGSESRFHGVATWATYFAIFLGARHVTLQRASAGAALLWAAAAASAGVVAYAALQALGLDPLAWGSVHRFQGQIRPASTLGNPTFVGAYTAMTTPIVFALALRAWRSRRRASGAVLVLTALGSLAVLAATLSRGAWLAMAASVGALASLLLRGGDRRGARALAVSCAAVALAGGLLLLTPVGGRVAARGLARLTRMLDPAREPRAEFWQAALGAFRDRPWLGAGPDTFQLVYPAHQSGASWRERLDAAPSHAHNEVLQVAVSQGALGLGVLAIALGFLVRAARRALRGGSADESALAAAAIAALVAFGVSVQFGFTVVATGTLAAVAMGLLAGRAAGAPGVAAGCGQAPWIAGAGLAGSAVLLGNTLATKPSSAPEAWLTALAVGAGIAAVAWASSRVESRSGPRPSAAGVREPARAWRSGARVGPAGAFVLGGLAAAAAALALERLVAEPFLADALLRRGRALLAAERPADAIPFLAEATRRSPGRELAWIELGVAHHRSAFAPDVSAAAARAQLEEARRAYERARDLEPADPLAHANRARALADLSRLDPEAARYAEAAEGFARALTLAPRQPRILEDASKAALLAHRYDEAEDLARRSLAVYPRHAAAWALAAGAAMGRGELESAEKRLRKALDSDWRGDRTAKAAAWMNLATVLARQGREEEARAASEKARALRAPEPEGAEAR